MILAASTLQIRKRAVVIEYPLALGAKGCCSAIIGIYFVRLGKVGKPTLWPLSIPRNHCYGSCFRNWIWFITDGDAQ